MKWTIYYQYITKNNLLFYKFIYTIQSLFFFEKWTWFSLNHKEGTTIQRSAEAEPDRLHIKQHPFELTEK